MINLIIAAACRQIMQFHFNLASATLFDTEEISIKDRTMGIMEDTCKSSPLFLLIDNNKWVELFKNEKWLTYLEGAFTYSALKKELIAPLKTISEAFPKETEFHIIPALLA